LLNIINFLLSAERVLDGSGISVAPPARRSNRLHAEVSKVPKPKAVTQTQASQMPNEDALDADDDDGDVNDEDEDANNSDENANDNNEDDNDNNENSSDKEVNNENAKGETKFNTDLDIHNYDYTNNCQGNTKHKANIKSIAKVKHVAVQRQSISPPADSNVLSQDETSRGRQKNCSSQANQQMHTSSHYHDEGIIF